MTATRTPPLPVSSQAPSGPSQLYRLSVQQYHQMIAAGILTSDDRVELLRGALVQKMSKNPPHRIATRLLLRALDSIVPAGWYVDSQEPIALPDSEPEPDAAVIRGDTRDYADRHPGPADIAMVAEVADSSLDRDRIDKLALYAEAGITTCWIVNLISRVVEVYTQPTGPAAQPSYGRQKDFSATDQVPVVLEGRQIATISVADLLP